MNTLHDVREAHDMWEYRFNNVSREGITLNCGKTGWIAKMLGFIKNSLEKSPAHNGTVYLPGGIRRATV